MENAKKIRQRLADPTAQMAFSWEAHRGTPWPDFINAPSNAAARKWLAQTGWPERRLLIWGPEATGKTHLLHDWARRRHGKIVTARMIDPARIDDSQLWAIDQLEQGFDPVALLHFINAAREGGRIILLASRVPPSTLLTGLADLSSRLRAMTAIEVRPAEDDLRVKLVIQWLAMRQICIAQDVATWLVHRLPRTNAALMACVTRLDTASLERKRALTRAFITETLPELSQADGEELPVS